ncbi:hypothetical protein KFE25_014131 [Diacronema lutheri]|uniref:Response regulatory domain-containing protein n=1 Tax=Diacronema lutheri TaxID=2081491 RepID=A0A8J5X690_DIALT|nr:hypothetical protein KFE25_014131 [Diacronema lutheri]
MIVACPVRHDAGADALAAPVVRGLPSDTSARLFPPGFRVLYAEDDRVLSFTMRLRVFKKLGVPTDYVENGQEAVAMAAGREYSVIVLDNQMPVMCGADAARALRAGGFAGTIIGVTGDPSGCVERGHFEASGLTMCVDKDSAGLAKLVEAISAFGLASDCAAPFEGIPCTPSGQLSDLSTSTTSLLIGQPSGQQSFF